MALYSKLFLFFFFIVFIAKYLIQKHKSNWTQAFLLLVSLAFYGYANLKFIPLLLGVGVITYISGRVITPPDRNTLSAHTTRDKLLTIIFIILELTPILAARAITFSGSSLVIPLGVSFFTLQAVTYTCSVYKGELEPEQSVITVLTFVTFFPCISSGPIQRAKDLIPLLKSTDSEFDYNQSTDGLKLIAWGLFKKLVIADNLAIFIQEARDPGSPHTGTALLLAAILYSFQLYLDFSGYSDIAIGSAKALGYDLKKNFDHPYLSRSVGEFWRRWHISLSSWLRDYVYFPIGGRNKGELIRCRNIFIIFVISGLWHGAGITWIVWGLYHALCVCTENLLKKFTGIKKTGLIPTFILVTFGWIIFSAADLGEVVQTIISFGSIPAELSSGVLVQIFSGMSFNLKVSLIALLTYIVISVMTRDTDGLTIIRNKKTSIRWELYFALVLFILFFSAEFSGEFIYNRF